MRRVASIKISYHARESMRRRSKRYLNLGYYAQKMKLTPDSDKENVRFFIKILNLNLVSNEQKKKRKVPQAPTQKRLKRETDRTPPRLDGLEQQSGKEHWI
jgi:hypothetical protein